MKLPKSLLSTMAVGIALATSSCSLGDIEEIHYATCDENCEVVHSEVENEEETTHNWGDCPACGLG